MSLVAALLSALIAIAHPALTEAQDPPDSGEVWDEVYGTYLDGPYTSANEILMDGVPRAPELPDPGPAGIGDQALHPLASAEKETVPEIDIPDWGSMPIFNSYFGTGFTSGDLTLSVAIGSPVEDQARIYVASDKNNRVDYFDATTLAHRGSFTGAGATFLGNPRGITYYRDEVYVLNGERRIAVFSPDGQVRRTFLVPGVDGLPGGGFTGIDAAWGEIWVSQALGGATDGGLLYVLDAQTGGLKGVVPSRQWPGCGLTSPVVDPEVTSDETCGTSDATRSRRLDVSVLPDANPGDEAIFVGKDAVFRESNTRFIHGYKPVHQTALPWAQLASGVVFPDSSFLPNPQVPPECVGCESLDRKGTDAVWGMDWFQAVIDQPECGPWAWCGDEIREYWYWASGGCTGDGGWPSDDLSDFGTTARCMSDRKQSADMIREWKPMQSSTGTVQDVVYSNRDARIDWSGELTDTDWQRGSRCLEYIVSDADIFVVGEKGERWYEPARNFEGITLSIDGEDRETKLTPSGNFCVELDSIPSGVHSLKLVARASGKSVTIANNELHVDHDPPARTVNDPGFYLRNTVRISGDLSDPHSGPRDWQLQVAPTGSGTWNDVCTIQAPGPYRCDWNTSTTNDGPYTLRVVGRDLVTPERGGPNSSSSTKSVFVDNTAPDLSVSGGLRDRADGLSIFEDERPPAWLSSTDSGSGLKSIEVLVGGARKAYVEQPCPNHGCSMSHDFVFQPRELPTGPHQIQVRVTDQAGLSAESEWSVNVLRNPPDGPDESATDAAEESGAAAATTAGTSALGGIPNVGKQATTVSGSETGEELPAEQFIEGTTLECAPDDPHRVFDVIDYEEPLPGLPAGDVSPEAAAASYLATTVNLPPLPPTMFSLEFKSFSWAIFSVQEAGLRRVWLLVFREPEGGWLGTHLGACSQFIDRFLVPR